MSVSVCGLTLQHNYREQLDMLLLTGIIMFVKCAVWRCSFVLSAVTDQSGRNLIDQHDTEVNQLDLGDEQRTRTWF